MFLWTWFSWLAEIVALPLQLRNLSLSTNPKVDVVSVGNTPVVLGISKEHIPEGISWLHKIIVLGKADHYNQLQTGGTIARVDLIPSDAEDYPELKGIDTVWLVYKKAGEVRVL